MDQYGGACLEWAFKGTGIKIRIWGIKGFR